MRGLPEAEQVGSDTAPVRARCLLTTIASIEPGGQSELLYDKASTKCSGGARRTSIGEHENTWL